MEEENKKISLSTFAKVNMGNRLLLDNNNTVSTIIQQIGQRMGNRDMADKEYILKTINRKERNKAIEISNYYYGSSGIYKSLVKYLATQYRYDYFVTPYTRDKKIKKDKLEKDFMDCLYYLDDFEVKKFFSKVSVKVIRDGSYYGYKIKSKDGIIIQDLPAKYCRNLYNIGKKQIIELNLQYFEQEFSDITLRNNVLRIMPKDIQKGWKLKQKGQIALTTNGDVSEAGYWYPLDSNYAFKFSIEDDDMPPLMNVIPAIIDLEEAKELDRLKMKQNLSKIIVQKFNLDKNSNLNIMAEDIQDFQNATQSKIEERTVGDVIVISTIADTTVEDMSDNNSSKAIDDLERSERGVYNESGVSQMQFNTDSNSGLQNSTNNDEASLYNLILQYESFLNTIISSYDSNKVKFMVQMLSTTRNNYIELSKIYKEQTQIGYSKMLPQVALGQSQLSILQTADFENDVLDLVNKFIPPRMSSTMGDGADLKNPTNNQTGVGNQQPKKPLSQDKGGAPKKDEKDKSDKTIANDQSKNR